MSAPASPAQTQAAPARRWAQALARLAPAGADQFFRSPLFWAGLGARLLLGSGLASFYLRDLFTPFVNYYVESGFADPWAHFAVLGRLNSFPYPPLMLYILALPRWLFSPLLAAGTETVTTLHLLVLRLPLILGDLAIALLLLRWFPNRARRVLIFYWWSPFALYISYWHGQLDVLPTALFLAGLALLESRRFAWGMVLFGLALATKSHLLVALPFLAVYLWQERGLWAAARLAALALLVYAALVLPYLGDPAFRQMVYGTEEQARLFAFQLEVGPSADPAGGASAASLAVLLAPGAIAVLWFRFTAYARRNWDLCMLYLGILFCVFILLAPPRPGYFMWSLPFLVYFVCRTGRPNALPYFAYAGAYLAFFWLGDQSDLLDAWRLAQPAWAAAATPFERLSAAAPAQASLLQNLLFTFMQASLAGIILHMYLVGVRSNAVYRARRHPVLLGIAGDSGAGKTTLCGLLRDVLGEQRLTVINGDDYHRWPRGHEKWQVYTHLNIRGSDVHQQLEHAIAMYDGRTIVKGVYDHRTGRFSNPQEVDPGEFIAFSGLHTLSLDAMRRVFDLKVFLDPAETLRRRWKLQRDERERGYRPEQAVQALEQRSPDRQAYILPQRETADVVISLQPGEAGGPDLTLELRALNGFDLAGLAEDLAREDALTVEHQPFLDSRWQLLRVAGDLPAERLHSICAAHVPNLREIAPQPHFAPGLNGVLQAVLLVCLSHRLRWTSVHPLNDEA